MTKKDFDEILLIYKDQITDLKERIISLREEKETLQAQVFRLQDGLMSVRAPEAYRDQQADLTELPVDEEATRRVIETQNLQRRYLAGMEETLFKDGDELVDMLGSVLLKTANESESIHGNQES